MGNATPAQYPENQNDRNRAAADRLVSGAEIARVIDEVSREIDAENPGDPAVLLRVRAREEVMLLLEQGEPVETIPDKVVAILKLAPQVILPMLAENDRVAEKSRQAKVTDANEMLQIYGRDGDAKAA